MKEVYTAIEEADTFIFILSPASTPSEICKHEIEHANKNNKRIIPIVINDVDPSSVHPVLAAINWVFSRTDDEFQPAIVSLITAIQTDFEWVKAHTRLQMRALEWERAGMDKSFLLRGTDLEKAENWISAAADKTPEPSLLQTRYLQTNRQEATKRQRVLLLSAVVTLLVTLVLSVIALFNWRNATEQRNIAVTRQLAAEALYKADKQLDLALLLGLETVQHSQGTPWASGILLEIIQTSPYINHILRGHLGFVDCVAFSPDGRILASGSWDSSIILWDVSTPGAAKPLGQPLARHTYDVTSVAFSPDGRWLASGSVDRSIILWDVSTPGAAKPLGQPLASHTDDVYSLAFSPDGRWLASGSRDKTIILWDVSLDAWKERACITAGRNLTQEEWDFYLPFEKYRETCQQYPLDIKPIE